MKKLIFLIATLWLMGAAFAQQPHFRVITYNILQGMRLDSADGKPAFVNWVRQQAPDVLALQEVTGFTQESLEKLAAAYGHPYAVLLIEGEKYPVAITSRYPIVNVQKVTDNMDRGFIMARIKDYNIVSLHFTPFDYRQRRKEVEVLLDYVKAQPDPKRWIIMGDFNTVSPVDSAHYSDGKLIEGFKAYEAKCPPRKKLVDGALDYTVIQKIMDNGFTDVVRKKYNAFVKTIHPRRFEPKNKPDVSSRIDFIFVSKDLVRKIADAKVVVDTFTDNHSDHYPVLLDLKTKK